MDALFAQPLADPLIAGLAGGLGQEPVPPLLHGLPPPLERLGGERLPQTPEGQYAMKEATPTMQVGGILHPRQVQRLREGPQMVADANGGPLSSMVPSPPLCSGHAKRRVMPLLPAKRPRLPSAGTSGIHLLGDFRQHRFVNFADAPQAAVP